MQPLMKTKKRGGLICFTGIDGSGKTSQALRLASEIQKHVIYCHYVWIGWTPTILKPITKLIKSLILKRKKVTEANYKEFTAAKRQVFENQFIARIWRNYVILDYAFQVFFKITIPMIMRKLIICDRYLYDIIVDFAINYNLSDQDTIKLIDHPLLRLFPKPTMVFLLDVQEPVAFERKNDIPSIEYLQDRRRIYLVLKDILNVNMINGDKDFEIIHNVIRREIFQQLGI